MGRKTTKWRQLTAILLIIGMTIAPPASNLKLVYAETLDTEEVENDLDETVLISEFKALSTVTYEFDRKPELETLLGYFPGKLKAFMEETATASPSDADRETVKEISVWWECELDYENAEATEYVFYPVWDEIGYDVTDSDSIPEIKVVILNTEKERIVLTAQVDDLEVTVTADAGVLPDGAELKAEKIEDSEKVAELTDAIAESADTEDIQKSWEDTLVLDVTIYDKEGNMIQPDTSKGTVLVTFHNVKAAQSEDAEDTLEVYHFVKDTGAVEKEEATVSDGVVECRVEHFSEFVIGRKVVKSATEATEISTVDALRQAIEDASTGSTLELKLSDGTFDLGKDAICLEKGISLTLTGAGADQTVLTGAVPYGDAMTGIIKIYGEKEEKLTLNDLKIENINGNAIAVTGTAKTEIHMDGVELLAKYRGISNAFDSSVSENVLDIKNSKILETDITDYTMDAIANSQYRGISLYNMVESEVTLNNCEIKGFGYSINVSGDPGADGVIDTHDLIVTLDNCQVYGWTSLNVWGSQATYNVWDTTIIGINRSNNSSNNFSAMTFNDDIYSQFGDIHAVNNTLNITDSEIKNYQGGSCVQDLLRIDCGITELNLKGNVIFEDTTGNIDSALYLGYMSDMETFLNEYINTEGATVICKGKNGEELSFVPKYVIANTYVSNGQVKTTNFASFKSAVQGVDYSGALANRETIRLLTDISNPDFRVNSEAGHGNQYGGWTLDLAGHSLTVAGWDADKVPVKDTSKSKAGKLYVNGKNIIAAKIGEDCFWDITEAIEKAEDGATVLVMPGAYSETVDIKDVNKNVTLKAGGEVIFSGGIQMTAEGGLTVDGFIFAKTACIIAAGAGNGAITLKNNNFAGTGLSIENQASGKTVVNITNNQFSEWKGSMDDEQNHAMYLADKTGTAAWTAKGNQMSYTGTAPHSYVKVIGSVGDNVNLMKNYWSGFDPVGVKARNGKPLAEVIPDWSKPDVCQLEARVFPAYKTAAMSDTDVITKTETVEMIAKPVENNAEVTADTVKVPNISAAEKAAVEAVREATSGQAVSEEVKAALVQKITEAATPENVAKASNEVAEQLTGNQAVDTTPAEGLAEAVVLTELEKVLQKDTSSISIYVKPVLLNVDMEMEIIGAATPDEVKLNLVPSRVTFEVSPYLTQYNENREKLGDDIKIGNEFLNGKIKFRLPIPEAVTKPYAEIIHSLDQEGINTYYAEILGGGSQKYAEVEVSRFSRFTVSFVDKTPEINQKPTPENRDDSDSSSANYTAGHWIQDISGWWYAYSAGGYPSSGWAYLFYGNKYGWYFFDANGYLMSGWVTGADGKQYYLNANHDGYFGIMLTGWVEIDRKWYYFTPVAGGPMGALLKNTTTPDGYQVNEKGERVQ